MITTVDELIRQLGGMKATAGRFGVGVTAVGNWKSRGYVPTQHLFAVRDALRANNLPEPAETLFQRPARDTEAA